LPYAVAVAGHRALEVIDEHLIDVPRRILSLAAAALELP
jgi:hypothetical protein